MTIDHDGGYESDTNAHEIEWHFTGMSAEDHDALNITPEKEAHAIHYGRVSRRANGEDQAIYDHICSLEPMTFDDDIF